MANLPAAHSIGKASHESTLNTKLAQLLRFLGLTNAVAESRQLGSLKQIDVEVSHEMARVAIEAEIANKNGAFVDASTRQDQARAKELHLDNVIALCYPKGLREIDFNVNTEVAWSVLPATTLDDAALPSWTSGTIWHLAGVVRRCRREGQQTPDEIAGELDVALSQSVEWLSEEQRSDLARLVGSDVSNSVKFKAAKRAMLIVVAACMFQARLESRLPSKQPTLSAWTGEPFHGSWPPQRLQECLGSKDTELLTNLMASWRAILAVDYRPIFEAAYRTLEAPSQNYSLVKAVQWVAKSASRISQSAVGMRHDLMGSIFHRLIESARYDGSYYTNTSSAILLAGLAIRRDDLPKELKDYSIIDPACGTGTLLMAAAERIRDLRPKTKARADATTLIEEVLTGLDVNMTACHMAATTLGLLSPSTTFNHMNIRLMPLGVDENNNAKVGSLELLGVEPGTPRLDLGIDWASGSHIDTDEQEEIAANSHQLVIMNPPYTRDSLRHDQFSPKIERQLKVAERQLTHKRAGHGSSSGTMFVDLGEHLTSLEDGSTLAFVYPASGAAAPSNRAARKLLAEWFHLDWIVASHDLKRTRFSESTQISEILVIARRQPSSKDKPNTKFLILRNNPSEPSYAASLVAALENDSLPAEIGTLEEWPVALVQRGIWRPLSLTSAHLVHIHRQIETQNLFRGVCLGELAQIGPDGRGVRGAFFKGLVADKHGRRALWHNDTRATQSLAAKTDTYIHAKPGKEPQSANLWRHKSRLMIAVSPRLNTARVNSVRVEAPSLGSLWVPVRFKSLSGESAEDSERALCAFLNSTLGWISMIAVASPKVLSRPAISLDALRRVIVPSLNESTRTKLAALYDKYADSPMQALRHAADDPTRAALDVDIASVLELDHELVANARRELANEPSVA